MYGVIYKIENRLDGKIYIGQTKNAAKRFASHRKADGGNILSRAIRKHGLEHFCFRVIDTACSKEWLDRKEEQWIAFYSCQVPRGYNIHPGGRGPIGVKDSATIRRHKRIGAKKRRANFPPPMLGKHHSESTKKVLSAHFKTLVRTPTHCRRIAAALTGIKRSPETCRRISESKTGKSVRGHPIGIKQRQLLSRLAKTRVGQLNGFYGKKHDLETRLKMKAAWTPERKASVRRGCQNHMWGTHASNETKAKLSKAHKGLCHSVESRQRIAAALRGHAVPMQVRQKIAASLKARNRG